MSLIAPDGRIIISMDMESKNFHQFEDGTKIRLERDYNNLNKRYTMPVNATVIASEYIPEGSQVLVHHNACHDVNRIFNYKPLSGEDIARDIRYFSLLESEVYLYREQGEKEWKPTKGFATALRLFKTYSGIIEGIEPSVVKDKLYITSECSLQHKVVSVLKSSDYTIIYMGDDGKDKEVIRLRHWEEEIEQEREEVVAIDHKLTEQVRIGAYLVGVHVSDAKQLNEYVCQN